MNTIELTENTSAVEKIIRSKSCPAVDWIESKLPVRCFDKPDCEVYVCRFLSDEASVEKIYRAREILLENIGTPVTIKELSRRIATNECYLKKGFKEIFGVTIFEFYQQQRMDYAKYLLYQKKLNVTDVADLLGYSSISHFSIAFKKYTGIKPCELLR